MFFLVTLFALAAGGMLFYAVHHYLIQGYNTYERKAIGQLSTGLADNFLFMDPKSIFMFTMVAMVGAGLFVWIIWGGMGALITILCVVVSPVLVLYILKKKRREAFVDQLPDCLSTLSMSLRAGSNFGRAMNMVVDQQPAPISQEFALVVSEVRMGRKIEEALGSLYERVKSNEVELFISAVSISRSVGGNLADTLESLADTIRERLQVEGKVRALTAMGRMQGWVVGAMPLLVTYVLYKREPESIAAMVYEPIGWAVLLILIILAVAAAYMIYKIVNIDI
ncbi:MAG: type II secretion system F family protein [Cellvibrionaceae bacterium]|nr:type II secretion system F family protein [Cellvibrionaceae bacterium]